MLPFIHYSKAPLTSVRSVSQAGSRPLGKPRGLWFSVGDGEDGWKAWCEGESFCIEALAFETEIILSPSARILRLSSVADIDGFTREYGEPSDPHGTFYDIAWNAVAENHDAIIIAPYCHVRRYEPSASWYYGWDVASGCVWNADAVERLIPRTMAIGEAC